MIASVFLLTASVIVLVGCGPIRLSAASAGTGHARRLGLWQRRIWLYLVLWSSSARIIMGSVGRRRCPIGIFPHLDWVSAALSTPLRQPLLQPVPRTIHRVPCTAAVLLFAMHGATILAVTRYGGERETRADRRPRHGVRARRPLLALDHGLSTPRWKPFTAGPGGSPFCLPDRWAASASLLTGTVVDNWYLWSVKHGVVPAYPLDGPVVMDPALMGAK